MGASFRYTQGLLRPQKSTDTSIVTLVCPLRNGTIVYFAGKGPAADSRGLNPVL
jgi:hypothetical protein